MQVFPLHVILSKCEELFKSLHCSDEAEAKCCQCIGIGVNITAFGRKLALF